ncbi:methyltransferase domain-containing protein, partial [Planktomarina temperata]|nr:methyltransferase domain-containing protein [Planktomarina temperata]
IRDSYYHVDFPDQNLKKKYNAILQLEDERSDNAGRVVWLKNQMNELNDSRLTTVCDIGAGLGVFRAKWNDLFPEDKVYCIEPDPLANEHLCTVLDENDVFSTIARFSRLKKKVDLICLNKVLEHIPNPVQFLKEIFTAIDFDYVYIEVPSLETLIHCNDDDNILGCLHCNLYNEKSLSNLMSEFQIGQVKLETLREPSGKYTLRAIYKRN